MSTESLATLIQLMDQLRAPGGCPWVAIQTHESLSHYAVEEAHEVAQAAELGDLDGLRDELADLLLQVVFHARIASEEEGGFDVGDVIEALNDKLIRRNPHVFGDAGPLTLAEVDAQWQAVKAQENPQRKPSDDLPPSLPALARAQKLYARLNPGAPAPSSAERAEVSQVQASIGEELWHLVSKAHHAGVDAEKALRTFVTSVIAND